MVRSSAVVVVVVVVVMVDVSLVVPVPEAGPVVAVDTPLPLDFFEGGDGGVLPKPLAAKRQIDDV